MSDVEYAGGGKALAIACAACVTAPMKGSTQLASGWPVGSSEMHARIRRHNWSATPLGSIDNWSPSLKIVVDLMLRAGLPTLLLWRKSLLQIYNDAYRLLIKERHLPLGMAFHESWPELRAYNEPIFDRVWQGETVVAEESRFSDWRPGTGEDAWFTINYTPVCDELGNVAGIWITVIDSTERVRAEATLRENEERLAQVLELLPVGVSLFNTEGDLIRVNHEMERLFDTVPHPVGAVPRLVFDRDGRPLERHEWPAVRALRGEFVRPELDLALEVDGAKRWLKIGALPFVRDGKITGGVAIAYDVTEAKESADRMQVLVAELQHRTRNLIAMVRVIADRTLDNSASPAEFRTKYSARLAALARVQGLVSQPEGEGVTFDQLLRAELEAHAALDANGRVTLDGPARVRLRPNMIQTLALALHELATNASKHGALAQPEGQLTVRWHLEPTTEPGRQQLCVDWRESGVVMPEPGERLQKGYGRDLIECALPYQFGVKANYALGADGVHCTLYLPTASDA